MGALDRRNLYYEFDDNYDPNIIFNINEYLIENWPKLSLKARTSVWTLVKDDDDFDLSVIEEQIDDAVIDFASTDPKYANDPDFHYDEEDEDEEDEEDDEDYEEDEEDDDDDEDEDDDDDEDVTGFAVNVAAYIEDAWPSLTEDQIQEIADTVVDDDDFDFQPLYEVIDTYVVAAAEADDSISLSPNE